MRAEQGLDNVRSGRQDRVGEKGLTLSGGQKVRVMLARAVYSRIQVLILDDILAALDLHMVKWIVDKCLRGDLVLGRTVLLVVSINAFVRDSSANVTQDPQHRVGRAYCGLCDFPWTRWPDLESRNSFGGP